VRREPLVLVGAGIPSRDCHDGELCGDLAPSRLDGVRADPAGRRWAAAAGESVSSGPSRIGSDRQWLSALNVAYH